MERDALGWRQFLGTVNLRDFSRMVWAELEMIGLSLRIASGNSERLPIGLLIFGATILLAVARLVLLTLFVIVFGGGILAIALLRGAARATRN